MNDTAIKGKTPDIGTAFANVVEAFGALVSTQVSSKLQVNPKSVAVVIVGLVGLLLGIILIAFGIRDALFSAMPNQAVTAVATLGCVTSVSALGLLLLFFRPKRS